MNLPHDRQQHRVTRAFTLIELLVVFGVIAVVASLLLPGLAGAKSSANAARCLNNKKQLQLAWLLYAHDHDDQLAPNGEALPGPPQTNHQYWWAQGKMNYQNDYSDNTNVNLLVDPQYARLGEYTKEAVIYKCPSDDSSVLIAGSKRPRVRTVSMNVFVGRCIDCFGDQPKHIGPKTVAALPNASKQFIFIDEHPDTINSTAFWLSPGAAGFAKIASYPGALHNGGATLSFADGHAENHRWLDSRTKPPVRMENWLSETESPNNPDVAWLQQQTYFP